MLHASLVGWIFWGGTQLIAAANRRPGGEGPRGGGGGGGASRVVFFELPDVAPPQEVAMAVPTPQELVTFKPPKAELPDIEIEMPKFEVPVTPAQATDFGSVLGRGAGTGGGPGAGTGTGGGIGSGRGTGIGDSIGPGTGGDGGHVFPPVPRQVILPPMEGTPGSMKGKPVVVTFWVTTDGRVTRIETSPSLPGGRYGRSFREKMMGYLFTPALTVEGRPIAATFNITLIL